MTTNRELLEAAARAAELRLYVWGGKDAENFALLGEGDAPPVRWNPLTDDGDAFRLAVKLGMNVFQAAKSAYALPSDDDGTYEEQVRYIDAGNDPYAATRRAVVRAAAALA